MKQVTVNRLALQAMKFNAQGHGNLFDSSFLEQVNAPELEHYQFNVDDDTFKALSENCDPLDIDEVSKWIIRQCRDELKNDGA